MTHDEALKLLRLAPQSNRKAIQAALEREQGELAKRLEAAPTPKLQALHQKQAAQLLMASQLLLADSEVCPDATPLSKTQLQDLPLPAPRATTASPVGQGNPGVAGTASSLGVTPGWFRLDATENEARPSLGDIPLASLSKTQERDLISREPQETTTGPTGQGNHGMAAPPSDTPKNQQSQSPLGHGELCSGQVLADRYEIRQRLGSGGMGVVYAAFDKFRGEEVALKLLLPTLLNSAQAREHFLEEAKIASSLSHPNIVRVYDLHQTAEHTFLSMELLRGRNLREEISRRSQNEQRFSIDEVRQLGGQLCAALHEAHKQLIHRDVKPENIWLCEDGSLKLMDFGIARLLRPSQFTTKGLALGTAYYMAPEQLKGGKDIDHRADQYAVGVVLYELLTGQVPQGAIQPPHRVRKATPTGLSEAVMRALAGSPSERFADMAAFDRALAGRRHARRRWLVAAAAAALALSAVAGFYFWPPPGSEDHASRMAFVGKKGGLAELIQQAKHVDVDIPDKESRARETVRQCKRELTSIPSDSNKDGRKQLAEQRLAEARATLERAANVAKLWAMHPQSETWSRDANTHLAQADDLFQRHDYAQALAKLEQAEVLFRLPPQWRKNAEEAIGLREEGESLWRKRWSSGYAQSLPELGEVITLWEYPSALLEGVGKRLLVEDAAGAVAEARRALEWLKQTEDLNPLRMVSVKEVLDRLALWEEVAELQKDCKRIRDDIQKGDEALRAGRAEEARQLYQAAMKRHRDTIRKAADHVEELVSVGWKSYRADQYDRALALATEAIRLEPRSADAFYLRGDAYYMKGDYFTAIADLTKALEIKQNHAQALATRGECYRMLASRKYFFEDLSEAQSGSMPAEEYRMAEAIRQVGKTDREANYEQALKDLTEAIKISPKDAFAHSSLAELYRQQKKYDLAIAECGEAIRNDPTYAWAYQVRGIAAHEKGQDESAAIRDMKKAVQLDPKRADFLNPYLASAHHARGRATLFPVPETLWFGSKSRAETAIQDFNEAITLSPKYAEAWYHRGLAYYRAGNYSKAIEDYKEVSKLNPEWAKVNWPTSWGFNFARPRTSAGEGWAGVGLANVDYNRGRALHARKEYKKAIDAYTKAIDHLPAEAMVVLLKPRFRDNDKWCRGEVYYHRGRAEQEAGEHDQAILDYTKAIELAPRKTAYWLGGAHYFRGQAYLQKGDMNKARDDSDKAKELGVSSPADLLPKGE